LALMAGAGTGKTHSLITLCLHLLGGARNGPAVTPRALGLLTFTEKAAAEMRHRLYSRLDALARGTGAEPDLSASFAALDKPMPGPEVWRALRDELGGAPIGTFHSLCVQLLPEAPPGRAFSPAFEVLDDRAALELLVDTADRLALRALERNDAAIADLTRQWSLNQMMGLTPSLIEVLRRMREEGQTADSIEIGSEPQARAEFAAALEKLTSELSQAEARVQRKVKPEDTERMVKIRRAATGLTLVNASDRLVQITDALTGTNGFPDLRKAALSV